MRLRTPALILPLASLTCFLASYVCARVFLSRQDDFGAGDLQAFFLWTAYFAILFLLPAGVFSALLQKLRLVNRVGFCIVLGAFLGFAWTIVNRWFLGPWFGAWSFPVLYCWIVGGVAGILTIVLLSRPHEVGGAR